MSTDRKTAEQIEMQMAVAKIAAEEQAARSASSLASMPTTKT